MTGRAETIPLIHLFHRNLRNQSEQTRRIYARYELIYTAADFAASICFVIGSLLYFVDASQTLRVSFYLAGSLFFASKPALRLVREVRLMREGSYSDLSGLNGPVDRRG